MKFLNLLDADGNLSITNLAMYLILIKIMIVGTVDYPAIIGLFITCLNYAHKRQLASTSASSELDIQGQIDKALQATTSQISALESTLTGVALKVGLK